MSDNVFYRLAPFIQEFIYRNNWTELRGFQVEACRVIFETDAHLLLSSGTASGKTEAAFLPVLTLLTEDPPASVGVLYIAPIKALINDQFLRLNDLLKEADIPVWHWHGDVSGSHKQKMIKNPSGVLQITPESLESLLINKNRDLVRIFGDLRFVVIDEVHAFMGTDRGIQVLCQLERLQRYIRTKPRRIGLSATLGDYTLAEKWLASGTDRAVHTPLVRAGSQKVRIAVEHFYEDPDDTNKKKALLAPGNPVNSYSHDNRGQESVVCPTIPQPFWNYLYDKTLNRKCIIFSNLREHAESSIATLRQIAELRNTPDIYHVHHGSISSSLRETAETTMKEVSGPVVIGATVSLELGIDIGRLERIIQLEAPASVSSFLQRLGRSGRRGNPSEMWFLCREQKPSGVPLLPYQIPWRLLQSIAIIQLYIKERWVEPPASRKYPLGMLYHQTMSIILSTGEVSLPTLEKRILGMACFSHITPQDFRMLIDHLVTLEHLQFTEEQGLIIGLEGEKITSGFRFLAVFPEDDEYTVNCETGQIGKVEIPPPVGERITIAGRNWEVVDFDMKQKTVFVKKVKGKINTFWVGGSMHIHNQVVATIRKVLSDSTEYPWLKPGAAHRLAETRALAKKTGLLEKQVFSLGGNTVMLLPWLGSVDYHVLLAFIRHFLKERFDLKGLGGQAPYFILARLGTGTMEEFTAALQELLCSKPDLLTCFSEDELDELICSIEYKTPKFNGFIPKPFLHKGYVTDYVHLENLHKVLV
ncbi:MAG: DEAD/DEAH box helicase [Thermoclostridium sp.]|nr:DEAD/DEAH box helicase [Thermoclostridium sp.]